MTAHKIMVVDDNSATRRMVRNALVRNGHDVIEAPDGKTAREMMTREHPRVVLQDLMLPDADGFKLVGELRALAGSEVSILAFSGFVSKLDEARVSTVGFDDIITKPIAPSRLVPIIEAHLPAAATTSERFGTGRRLVIADDDPMQLKLAAFRLGRLGFEVEVAPDGAAALEAIRKRLPDAVISDVMMPELDGFGLAMALRQDPALAMLPLLLVTSSYVETSDRELARRAGATDLVVRTPELEQLIELLRVTLEGEQQTPTLAPEVLPELERERNRRVFRQLERQVMLNTGLAKRCSSLASELTVLTGIAEAVLKNRDVDAALDEAIASCFDAGGISFGALYLIEGQVLRVRALGIEVVTRAPITTFFGREALLRSVIQAGESLYVPSPSVPADVGAALLQDSGAKAMLIVPLTGATGPLGALMMVSRGRDIDEADWRSFAQGVALQISQVLTLARAYADLEAAERKSERHAALLEAVVESAPDNVLQLDRDGVIRFINRVDPPATIEGVLGKNWFVRIAPEHGEMARRAFDTVIATGQAAELEINVTRVNDSPAWFQLRLGAVKQEGQVTGCVIVARDVTDKKQTEMQLMLADRMASVGTLAAGVAHEINNPLASVIANLDMAEQDVAELATRTTLPKDLAEELHDARTSADRVREIVRDLKVFSRAQEDRRGAVDVEKVLESTLRMAWNELRHRAKVIKTFSKVPRVDANEGRLGQVFLNLIVNAVQAIPEGNYENNEIRLGTALVGDQVVITVGDTGSGIPPHVQRRLFTPFFTTKPSGIGTGLGLAISHRIITSLGGTIDLETEVGKGTTFRVRIPVASSTLAPVSQRLPTTTEAKRRGRVLVIDDEESLVQAMKRYLSHDHEVTAVTSARLAIELVAKGERYDAVVCDLMMPQVTGMEVHAAILAMAPELAAKMVFVTGGAFTESARQFLDTTPNPRIEKPFDLKVLRSLINELIG